MARPDGACAHCAVDVVEKGQYVTLRNAKIDMYKGLHAAGGQPVGQGGAGREAKF